MGNVLRLTWLIKLYLKSIIPSTISVIRTCESNSDVAVKGLLRRLSPLMPTKRHLISRRRQRGSAGGTEVNLAQGLMLSDSVCSTSPFNRAVLPGLFFLHFGDRPSLHPSSIEQALGQTNVAGEAVILLWNYSDTKSQCSQIQ